MSKNYLDPLNRPRSFSGNILELEKNEKVDKHEKGETMGAKKKKKWKIAKMFNKSQEFDKNEDKHMIRQNSGEMIASLQEKVQELESQIDHYKQSRRESSIKRKNVHQQNLLDSTNYKEFMFKGVLVVKNKYGEEIDSIDIIPDQIEIVETQDEHYLKHVIEDIGYVVLPSDGDHQNPKTISFFYYLRRHNELRYDYLFNVALSQKDLIQETREFIESKTEKETSFTQTDYCNSHEIKTVIEPQLIGDKYVPSIKSFLIQINLTNARLHKEISLPVFTTKTLQNYWFRLEIVPKEENVLVFGPFFPSEQHLNMEDSHYFIEQEIPLQGFAILGVPNENERKIEKRSSFEHIYSFHYYSRDRSYEDSPMFCLASVDVSLAEVVKSSEGNQKVGGRFKLEKQYDLGMIKTTFHFFVSEEMIPQPLVNGHALNPLCGYWLLERITFAVRI